MEDYDFSKDAINWEVVKKVTFAKDTKKEADQTKVEEHDHLGVFFLVNKDNIDQEAFKEDGDVNECFPVIIPTKYHKHPSIVKAKQEELDKWIKYEAYIEVNEVENMKLITMR